MALVVIGFVAWANIRGFRRTALFRLLRAGLVNLVLLVAIIVYGRPRSGTRRRSSTRSTSGTAPTVGDLVFAAVVAGVAVIGIESASGLAGEIRVGGRGAARG